MISDKVRPHHLERKALLYVRQSSAHQVLHNRESSALQYAMRDRLTLPSCFANSSTPTLLRMIFSSLVIVSSPRSDTPMSTLGDDTPTTPTCQI